MLVIRMSHTNRILQIVSLDREVWRAAGLRSESFTYIIKCNMLYLLTLLIYLRYVILIRQYKFLPQQINYLDAYNC